MTIHEIAGAGAGRLTRKCTRCLASYAKLGKEKGFYLFHRNAAQMMFETFDVARHHVRWHSQLGQERTQHPVAMARFEGAAASPVGVRVRPR